MLVPLLLLQVKSPMTMTEKILAKHSDNGLVVPGQVRRRELLLGWHSMCQQSQLQLVEQLQLQCGCSRSPVLASLASHMAQLYEGDCGGGQRSLRQQGV
jgi:hypothetical protein